VPVISLPGCYVTGWSLISLCFYFLRVTNVSYAGLCFEFVPSERRQLKMFVHVGESIRCRVCGNRKNRKTAFTIRPPCCPTICLSDFLLGHLCHPNSAQCQAVSERAAQSVKDERVSSRTVCVCWCVLHERQVQMPSVRHAVSVWPGPQHRTPRSSAVEYG